MVLEDLGEDLLEPISEDVRNPDYWSCHMKLGDLEEDLLELFRQPFETTKQTERDTEDLRDSQDSKNSLFCALLQYVSTVECQEVPKVPEKPPYIPPIRPGEPRRPPKRRKPFRRRPVPRTAPLTPEEQRIAREIFERMKREDKKTIKREAAADAVTRAAKKAFEKRVKEEMGDFFDEATAWAVSEWVGVATEAVPGPAGFVVRGAAYPATKFALAMIKEITKTLWWQSFDASLKRTTAAIKERLKRFTKRATEETKRITGWVTIKRAGKNYPIPIYKKIRYEGARTLAEPTLAEDLRFFADAFIQELERQFSNLLLPYFVDKLGMEEATANAYIDKVIDEAKRLSYKVTWDDILEAFQLELMKGELPRA